MVLLKIQETLPISKCTRSAKTWKYGKLELKSELDKRIFDVIGSLIEDLKARGSNVLSHLGSHKDSKLLE